MTTQHTPGPWRIVRAQLDSGYVCRTVAEIRSKGGLVANVLTEEDEGRANACVIAAAPDLLMVLERLISDFHDEGRAIQPGSPIWEALHKVVAKAKGGSNA